jgi:hypothetical protein
VLRFGDGDHLHLETKKLKKKGAEPPFLLRLGDGAHLCSEETKPKKGRRGTIQASF